MSRKCLKKAIDSGELELIHVISARRTLSTVFQVALTEVGHGQINEPFHHRKCDSFDEGCVLITQRVEKLLSQTKDRPIRLVVKDLADNLNLEEWRWLLALSGLVVLVVREPTLHFFSLLRRRVNDLFEYDSSDLED